MAVNLQQVKPYQPGSNPAETWSAWRKDFETYLIALKYHKEDHDTQIALFLHVCGEELKKHYRSFTFPSVPDVPLNLKVVLDKFDDHYKAYKNPTFASFIFWGLSQGPEQSFDEYLAALKHQADECDFEQAKDRNIKDKIIHGIKDTSLRERLLREPAITLEMVVNQCKAAELSKSHASAMSTHSKSVEFVSREQKNGKQQQNHRYTKKPTTTTRNQYRSGDNSSKSRNLQKCSRCGREHDPRECPAFGATCRKCGKLNHWAVVCRQTQSKQFPAKRINYMENEQHDDDLVFLGELHLDSVHAEKADEWYQEIQVNGQWVKFKLDTGAQVNILSKDQIVKWPTPPKLSKTDVKIATYTGERLNISGECYLQCCVNNQLANLKFHIIEMQTRPILGASACQELGLIQRVQALNKGITEEQRLTPSAETPESIIQEYEDVFVGIGKLDHSYKIVLQQPSEPHVAAPRKIPIAQQDKVQKELSRMLQLGIIEKVNTPTEWVNNIVVVEKGDKIRICLDPRPLNAAIKRSHYPIPSAEELTQKLQGSKIFSLLDVSNAFWHVVLDEESSYLTTFITPFGKYRFLRMPFGLNCAPEAFQQSMDGIFASQQKVNTYFDDIVLGSQTMTEHCHDLRQTLEIARKENIKLNKEKLQLAKQEIKYLGHIVQAQGICPDPQKIEAIVQFPPPTDRQQLLRFLGMVTYLGKYLPHLSHETHLLRSLLKNDVAWFWDTQMQQQFDHVKKLLTTAPTLAFFNPKNETTLHVDASKFGMGAVMVQDNHPIAYASTTLTPAQVNYSQIEKELGAVLFGLEKFHYYTYGRPILVCTDHKPLLGLSTKQYDKITPRLQRMLLRLNRYDVTLTYVPGKLLTVADALSRAPLPSEEFHIGDAHSDPRVHIIAQVSDTKLVTLQKQTRDDNDLQVVSDYIRHGWPKDKRNVPHLACALWHCKDELHLSQDLILRGQRIVIPKIAQEEVLQRLHSTHKGIVATKSKARETVYWPGMDADIEKFVSSCIICQQYQRSNQHEPLISREIPPGPWMAIGIDFFYLQDKAYILICDYYSKFVEIQLMRSTTASAVVNTLKSVFARYGVPYEIVSDQGPPFTSQEMKRFYEQWDITHNPSSPFYARSNGLIERHVATVKNRLRKAHEAGEDLYAVLLELRSTPSNGLPSPAELLMGRKIRSLVPTHPSVFTPSGHGAKKVIRRLQYNQDRQHRFSKTSKLPMDPLNLGESVWHNVGKQKKWSLAKVVQIGPAPRRYVVEDASGMRYQRNRLHLKPAKLNLNENNGKVITPSTSVNVTTPEDYYSCGSKLTRPNAEKGIAHGTIPTVLIPQDQSVQQQPSTHRATVRLREPPSSQDATDTRQESSLPQEGAIVTRSGRAVTKPSRFM